MKTLVVDFEEILKNYSPYHESLKLIQKEKKEFGVLIEEIRKEMESIINSSKSLILDDVSKQNNQIRFRELQSKAVSAENEFRSTINAKQNEELEKNFQSIMDIVNEWTKDNEVDVIINKNAVVYTKPEFEITKDIIEVIKDKSLFLEYVEGMYEEIA